MSTERPINLAILDYLPLTAIVSITHRVTGVFLFVGVAFMLYGLELALSSEAGFEEAQALLETGLGKFVAWGVLSVLAYHFVAGIKHLFMDFHVGDTLEGSRRAAYITVALSGALIVMAGLWVW